MQYREQIAELGAPVAGQFWRDAYAALLQDASAIPALNKIHHHRRGLAVQTCRGSSARRRAVFLANALPGDRDRLALTALVGAEEPNQ